MAVAEVKKIQILAHQSDKERIIEDLHKAGVVEVASLKEKLSQKDYAATFLGEIVASDRVLEEELVHLAWTIEYLTEYEEPKGFAETVLKPKPALREEELFELARDFDYKGVYAQCIDIDKELKEISTLENKYLAERAAVLPWLPLKIPIEEIAPTKFTVPALGVVPASDFPKLVEELEQEPLPIYVESVSEERGHRYLFLIYSRSEEVRIQALLKEHNFTKATLPEYLGTPASMFVDIEKGLSDLSRGRTDLLAKIKSLVHDMRELRAVYDLLSLKKSRLDVQSNFLRSNQAFMVQGWVREDDVEPLKKKLEARYSQAEIIFSAPEPDEKPPVILENKKVIKPFEVITDLYGRPHYAQIDPTPLLAPFFFIFFGLCLTDAGYGLLLILLAFFLTKKLKLEPQGKKFVNLILFVGIATVFAGAIMGGWFGDALEMLPPQLGFLNFAREKVALLDPLRNPRDSLIFIGLTLVLGIVQVLFGIGVKLYDNLRKGRLQEALFVNLSWLLLLPALIPVLAQALFKVEINKTLMFVDRLVILWSVVCIIFFQGGKSKNVFTRVLKGLYGLYGITGYMADILSYFRLFALGLATSGIAMAINAMVKMAGGTPFIGPLLGLIIFVFGHMYNLAINMLSAFVHTCRLQFLEFFTKFYQGGGKIFAPFRRETKYVLIRE